MKRRLSVVHGVDHAPAQPKRFLDYHLSGSPPPPPPRKISNDSHNLDGFPPSLPTRLLRRLGAILLSVGLACGLLAEPVAAQTTCSATDTAVTAVITDTNDTAGRTALAADCAALLGLMDTLRGTASLNWVSSLSMASWDGVTVTGSRVTALHLENWQLTGTIPDLSALTELTILALSDNLLTGSLDASHFPAQLQDLYLQRNQLSGSIPSLNSLTGLVRVWLHQNQFTNALPTTWNALTSLTELHLAGNDLTGPVPSQIGSLTSLTDLSMCASRLNQGSTLPSALETRRTGGHLTVWSCVILHGGSAAEGMPVPFTLEYHIYPARGEATATDLTLSYETTDGTATDGEDYTGTSTGSVTIPGITDTTHWASNTVFNVPTLDDATAEHTETFTLTLSGFPSSGVLPIQGAATGVILNDDGTPPPPALIFSPDMLSIQENESDTYTVVLSGTPTADVTVTVSAGTGVQVNKAGGTAGSTQTLTFSSSGTNVWSTPQTITVTGVANMDGARTVTITHATTSSDTDYNSLTGSVGVTVTDAVDPATPVVSVGLPDVEGVNRTATGEFPFEESVGAAGMVFNLTATPAPVAALTVCVRVTEAASGGVDRVASSAEGIQTVTIATTGVGSHTVTWTNTAVDDPDSVVTLEVVAPETASCSATNGSYAVAPGPTSEDPQPSDKARITDDEMTTVPLTSTDMTMSEGDPSDTAVVTVSMSRRLYAGESVDLTVALTSPSEAALPGETSPDFTWAGSGTGVTVTGASGNTLRLVFEGHDTDTVETATITLTPTARDDGDNLNEIITAALSVLTGTGTQTNVNGGAAPHGTNNRVTLTIDDDEEAPPDLADISTLRVGENGDTVQYTVTLTTAPVGGNTTVTIVNTNNIQNAITLDKTRLTFTPTNYMNPQVVTITGVDEPGMFRDRDLLLTHLANGGGYNSKILKNVTVTVQEAPQVEPYHRKIWLSHEPGPVRNGLPLRHTTGFDLYRDLLESDFRVRASDRPVNGPITVTITAAPTYVQMNRNGTTTTHNGQVIQFSLTKMSPRQNSLTITFENRAPGPNGCRTVASTEVRGDGKTYVTGYHGETIDNVSNISFHCPRHIEVWRKNVGHAFHGYQEIIVTATGGSVRASGADAPPNRLRVHLLNRTGDRSFKNQVFPFITPSHLQDWWQTRPDPNLIMCVLGGRFASPTQKSCIYGVDQSPMMDASVDMSWVPDGVAAVHEGTTTSFEVDLGVEVQRGQTYEVVLKPSGATMGDDYTLSLDTANSKHVSVDPNAPLDSAAPRLIFQPGAQVARLDIKVLNDAVHEREVLTIGFGEYRYKVSGKPDKVIHPKKKYRYAFIDATPAIPVDTVTNVQVSADDATTATATWDAVEHATSYEVEWDALDGDGQAIIAGIEIGIAGTTATIRHDTPEVVTLTVTVIPAYEDENGVTHLLDALAGTATLDMGMRQAGSSDQTDETQADPEEEADKAQATDYTDLITWMYEWRNDPQWVAYRSHTDRWDRALLAFGQPVTDTTLTPMTAAEAQAFADRGWTRWVDVAEALWEIEAADSVQDEAPPATDDPPVPDPHAPLIAQMYEWRNDPQWVAYQAHTDRWDRALLAFGEAVTDPTLTPMTAAQAQGFADRGWTRWVDVAAALRELEANDP